MPRLARWATFLLIASCGGDDSDGNVGPPPGETPFAVSTVAPVDGATDVEIDASVTARFNVPVDPSTLTAASFTLSTGDDAVPAAVDYDAASQTARLAAPLLPGTTYRAAVTTAVQDAQGVPLAKPLEWTFVTRPWQSVALEEGIIYGPSLLMDAQGALHQAYGNTSNLKYATCSGACLSPASWQSVTVDGGETPSLAMDATGGLHVTYDHYVGGSVSEVKYAACAASCLTAGNWRTVSLDQGSYVAEGSSVSVDGAGRTHLAYLDRGNGHVKYASCEGTCGAAADWQTVTVARLNADRPSLVVDGTGRVHITFEDIGPEATHTNLVYATCTADCLTAANWQRVMVDPTPLTGAANSLVVDANGRVHVAYTNGTGFQIRYATCGANCTAASSWEIVGIGTPLGGGAPSLAVDPTGRVHISYGQFINFNDSELRYATCATRCMDLANWQFSLLAPATIRGTSLVVDAAGRLRLAYAGILTLQYSE